MLTFAALITIVTLSDALTQILSTATALQFPVTAWFSGSVARTLLTIFAQKISDLSAVFVVYAKAGFLDFAAQITPEYGGVPFVGGWLDSLASSVYQVTRIQATRAGGALTFVNTTAAAPSFAVGTMHVADTATGATYKNDVAFTIAASATTSGVAFSADVAGSGSTAGAGAIDHLVTPITGVTVSNPQTFVGADAETNAALVARCRARLGALSPNGPKLAYDYFARTIPAPAPLVPVTSGSLSTPKNPVTRSVVKTSAFGVVTTYVASSAGPYVAPDLYTGSVAKTVITSATNGGNVQFRVTAHGYTTGDVIYIANHLNGAVPIYNGPWSVLAAAGTDDADHFTVALAWTANGAGGTSYRQADLDLIDKSIQAFAVPWTTTAITLTAIAKTINLAGTIVLKRGATTPPATILSQAQNAIIAAFAALPLGGDNQGGGSYYFFIEPMRTAVESSSTDIIGLTGFTANSATVDVPVTTDHDVPTLGTFVFAIVQEV